MKIGIVTLYEYGANYGNKLQNYAVEIVLGKVCPDSKIYTLNFFNDFGFFEIVKSIIHKITNYRFAKDKNRWENEFQKIYKFYRFDKSYLHVKREKLSDVLKTKYDHFVVGSDQVWNPNWYNDRQEKKNVYLLEFANDSQKICLAPSFGLEMLPNEWEQHFKDNLNGMKWLSVRENAGQNIIKKLTGLDALVLVDPTLLLGIEDWKKIEKKPKIAKKNYVLTYFLSPKCLEAEELLSQLRKTKAVCEINGDDKTAYDPSEFIWLFENAELILTDSFHACVFSFLFNKPFLVYDRNWKNDNMNSRIETLLQKFCLERKYVGSGIENDIWEHDYLLGHEQLELEREKAYDFLNRALKGQ